MRGRYAAWSFFAKNNSRQYHSLTKPSSDVLEALGWLEKNNARAYTAFVGMCRGEKSKLHATDYDFQYLIATGFLNRQRLPHPIYERAVRKEKNLSPVSCYLPNGVAYTESTWTSPQAHDAVKVRCRR